MLYMKVNRVNPKSSHHKEEFFSLILYLYEMMDVHYIYCDNHFMIYVKPFCCIPLSYTVLYINDISKFKGKNERPKNNNNTCNFFKTKFEK